MKRLYALLVILIIAYIGINVVADNLNLTGDNATMATDNSNGAVAGNASFPKLDNFTDTKINDTTVIYNDSNNMSINLNKLDNSKKIEDIVKGLDHSKYTSNQTIDQNGVTTYFLYNEGPGTYSADIYFNKNGQNFMISGTGISYENSDYFINHCKSIIDSIGGSGNNTSGLSRW